MVRNEIVYVDSIVSNAYHGTSSEAGRKIVSDGFLLSSGPDQFLGDGVYFFEGSRDHALDWARRRIGGIVAVIKSTIRLGKCLDLNNKDYRKRVKDFADGLRKTGIQKVTDTVAINTLAKLCEIETVRACYVCPKYGRMFQGSRFYDYAQLIICVRNRANITSRELVLERKT